jgi:hypothetical protein
MTVGRCGRLYVLEWSVTLDLASGTKILEQLLNKDDKLLTQKTARGQRCVGVELRTFGAWHLSLVIPPADRELLFQKWVFLSSLDLLFIEYVPLFHLSPNILGKNWGRRKPSKALT